MCVCQAGMCGFNLLTQTGQIKATFHVPQMT